MIFLSIDLETTGLDPVNNQIIEFGAVLEDTNNKLPIAELPKFQVYIDNGDLISGHPFALQMNHVILKRIATKEEGYTYIKPRLLGPAFQEFLKAHLDLPESSDPFKTIHINVAGKNFGSFDLQFLNNCELFNDFVKIRQRIIDPGVLCVDWENDESLPALGKCKSRYGLSDVVTHNAVDDAIDVIEVLRNFY